MKCAGINHEYQLSNVQTPVFTMEPDDLVLVDRARGGDQQSFKVLVDRHEGAVAGVVHSMLGPTPEAADVGQEVFVRFYQALDKFKGESAVRTYLVRIAINLSLNELRRRKRRMAVFTKEEEGLNRGTSESNDLRDAVRFEVNKLDPDFQSVVTLRLLEGYSTSETAEILNVPLGTVLSRLSRAQKKLKGTLEKYLKE